MEDSAVGTSPPQLTPCGGHLEPAINQRPCCVRKPGCGRKGNLVGAATGVEPAECNAGAHWPAGCVLRVHTGTALDVAAVGIRTWAEHEVDVGGCVVVVVVGPPR